MAIIWCRKCWKLGKKARHQPGKCSPKRIRKKVKRKNKCSRCRSTKHTARQCPVCGECGGTRINTSWINHPGHEMTCQDCGKAFHWQ